MAVSVNDWVGSSLSGGRYRVDAKLGEGGMGFVYKVWDRNLDADLVVKVPRRAMLEDAEFAGRFASEIRSLVRLSHPNIVKVTDVGEHDGLPFAVMQFLPGGDLEGRQKIGRDGRGTPAHPSTLAGWLPGVASALDFIHREKYIHRDVKPANILFDGLGHAFLSDFGVAKVLGDVEATGRGGRSVTGVGIVLGTPEYMAPELVMGEPFDGRIDQYALAATAYEMLCGRKAFAGETATAILVRQANQPPPPLAELPEPGSDAIARVILRAMAKQPGDRYGSCGEFARALVEAADLAGPARAVVVPDRLICPLCARTSPIPAVVLADPSRAAGRKTACPGCKAPLQFADDGLSLVVPGTVAPSRAGTMAIESPSREASSMVESGLPRTMKVETGRVASRGAATEAIVTDPPAKLRRDAPSPSTNRARPAIVGGLAVAALSLVGLAVAFAMNREEAAPAAPPRTRPRIAAAVPTPGEPPAKIELAKAGPAVPPPSPKIIAPRPEARSSPPAADLGASPSSTGLAATPGTMQAMIVRPANPAPTAPVRPEPGPPVDDTPVVDVTFKQLADEPEKYAGRVVIPADLLKIDTHLGFGRELPVASRQYDSQRPGDAGSKFKVVLSRGIANHLENLLDRRQLIHGTYPPILRLRVDQDPAHEGDFIGMVDRVELLWNTIYAHVASRKYDRAFQVVVITDEGVKPGLGDGKAWESRLSGSYLNHIRLEYHRMQKIARNQQFDQMQGQVARNAAEMASMAVQAQKQQQVALERLMGKR